MLLRAFSLSLTGGLFMSREAGIAERSTKSPEYELMGREAKDGRPAFYRTSPDTAIHHMGGPIRAER